MTIDFNSLNVFQKFPSFIPWFDTDKGAYAVIVQPAVQTGKKTPSNPEILKESAANALIEYYLPEFYPLIYGGEKTRPKKAPRSSGPDKGSRNKTKSKGKSSSAARSMKVPAPPAIPPMPAGVKDSYNTIRKQILNNLKFIKSDQGEADLGSSAPIAPKHLYNTTPGAVNFKRIRAGLRAYDPDAAAKRAASTSVIEGSATDEPCLLPGEAPAVPSYSSGLPSFDDAKRFFVEQQFNSMQRRPGNEIIISLGDASQVLRSLSTVLDAYDKQITRYPAPLKIPLALEAINTESRIFVSHLVAAVRRDLNLSGKTLSSLSADDILRIQLGPDQNILGASYELETLDGLEVGALKIGFFSLVKYNRIAQDPWLIQTLVNHQRIISDFDAAARGSSGLSSILNFIKNTYGPLLSKPTIKDVVDDQPVKITPDGTPGEDLSVEIDFQAPPPPGVDPLLYNSVFQAAESSMKLDYRSRCSHEHISKIRGGRSFRNRPQ
mgnify:FL=1